ncbi:MAG: hypothetical protein H6813_00730 [Phycisphaeraceae bacterium]|nr:hypothetical protein [Phycisphaeraceae bacterium]MCB9847389.1 hypothetical protein [Phycisphaeraceae bacterium]
MEPEPLGYDIEPQAPRTAPSPAPAPTGAALPPPSATGGITGLPDRLRSARVQRGFWQDVGKSFTFLSELDNSVVIIGYAFLMTIYPVFAFMPVIGIGAMFVFYGMLFAFYFDIVQTTAGGEDDLPSLSEWDGFVDSGVLPVLKFVGTSVVASLPGIVGIFALGGLREGQHIIAVILLFAIGWFFWPAIVLAVATLGYGLVLRVDLLVRTPFASFGAYLAIIGMLIVAMFLQWFGASAFLGDTTHQVMSRMNIAPASVPGFLFGVFESFVINAISISSTAISMRLIGLYYRHYSPSFPWSAG